MICWVTPKDIKKCLVKELSIHEHINSTLDGDWDLETTSFDEKVIFFDSFKQRLGGANWEDTLYFETNIKKIESGTPKWHCKTKSDFLERCKNLDRIYDSIKENGFVQSDVEDCIAVALSRNGEMLFCNGGHRLTFAKLLNLPSIPVRVIAQHKQWVNFCAQVAVYAQRNSGKIYAPIAHPFLSGVPAFHMGRASFILDNILPSSKSVLDIGSHWGYFPTLLEKTGRKCVAVEQSEEQLFFLRKIRTANALSFEIVQEDIFDYLKKSRSFDTVLALAIFHHFLKTKKLHDQLREMLGLMKMEELFLLTHSPQEPQMQSAYANYAPKEFAQFIVDNSCLDTIDQLASFNDRILYRISKQKNAPQYISYKDDFKIVFFAFVGASHPQILRKVNGQYKGLLKIHPNSECVVMGTGSDDIDLSSYCFKFIDLREYPNGEKQKGFIAESVLLALAPDIVYMRYPIANESLAHVAHRVPNIVFEHQSKELEELVNSDQSLYQQELALGTNCLHRAAGVIGVTHEITDYERNRAGGFIPSATMGNGISPEEHPLSAQPKPGDTIHALVVADFRYWHGLDRLIKGCLKAQNIAAKLHFHIVGFGPALNGYKNLIEKSGVKDSFTFYGHLSQKQIDPIADICSFGVGALASFRKKLTQIAALKHREYALRGLPFIYSGSDIDFPVGVSFCRVIPDDESPIDIEALYHFAEQAQKNPLLRLHAREFALTKLSWSTKMKTPVALCRHILGQQKKNDPKVTDYSNKATDMGKACAFFQQAQLEMQKRNYLAATTFIKKYSAISNKLEFIKVDNRTNRIPDVSVIIVAYYTNSMLIQCIQSVLTNHDKNFEIIVVDNGGNQSIYSELRKLPVLHLIMPDNLILSEGRNIGARHANGRILALLDDDALVPDNYISSIRRAFANSNVLAIRGKVLPKTDSENNVYATHYDLGENPIPSLIDTEGNSAFLRTVYNDRKGMDPLLFGHEGIELGYRILLEHGGSPLWYWPETRIFHDFAPTQAKLKTKTERHETLIKYLYYKHPRIGVYLSLYNSYRHY